MAINQQAVNESKKAIIDALDENVRNLEKEEYKDVLQDVISDLESRLESVNMEIEDESEEEPD